MAGGPFKFTVTSPYMLARTLLDNHYGDFESLLMAIAGVLAQQVAGLPCDCLQIDEANIPGNPADAPLAASAINCVLDAFQGTARRASLLRQLRRPDHSKGRVARARRTSSTSFTWITSCSKWRTARPKIWSR